MVTRGRVILGLMRVFDPSSSVGAGEVLDVGLGSAPKVKNASPEEGDDVAGTTGLGDLCDEARTPPPSRSIRFAEKVMLFDSAPSRHLWAIAFSCWFMAYFRGGEVRCGLVDG